MEIAEWHIEINCYVECPYDNCYGYMELLNEESLEYLNEEWQISKQILWEEFWCDDLGIEIKCDDCNRDFKVWKINW